MNKTKKDRLNRVKRQLGRVPLPRKMEKSHSTKKGKRGYRRPRNKQQVSNETD